ncbi:MAG: hypothetical protein ACK4OK_09080, partial [Thermoflexus sp.]
LYGLEAQSLWYDEGTSARLSEGPLRHILESAAQDIHPPLYYVLLHGWTAVAGRSVFALRAFSALAGVLVVLGFVLLLPVLLDNRNNSHRTLLFVVAALLSI